LGILCLINAYALDGQHKEPQQQQQREQQRGEQAGCQPATTPSAYSSQAPPPPPRDRLGEFQRTKKPTFSQALEPMDADDWLKSVEKKLQVVQCNNHEKVLLASHQLSGPAFDWWDAYVEAHEEPESINWPEFRAAFHAHHVPQ
jgi:hypothetical protein